MNISFLGFFFVTLFGVVFGLGFYWMTHRLHGWLSRFLVFPVVMFFVLLNLAPYSGGSLELQFSPLYWGLFYVSFLVTLACTPEDA